MSDFTFTPWGLRELGKKKQIEYIQETKLIDEHKTLNIKVLKDLILFLLYWSQPHKNINYTWPENSKIFIFYIYSVIEASKQKCYELIDLILNKDKKELQKYIEWSINFWPDKQEEIQHIINRIQLCYYRFSIYEIMLKDILLINPKEINEIELIKKFPEWNKIPIEALELLEEYIVNPIFYGKFSSNFEKKKFLFLEDGQLKEIEFPFDIGFNKEDRLPDALLPFILIKDFGFTIEFARQHVKTWSGTIDEALSKLTGKNNDYVFEYGKKGKEIYDDTKKAAENAYNTAAGVASDMTEFTKAIYGAISGVASNVNDLSETLKPLAALIGVGLAFSVLGKLVD